MRNGVSIRQVVIVSALLIFGIACRQRAASDRPDKVRRAFVMLADATAVHWSEDSLTYRVRDPYPAVMAISEIDASLKARGWTPLSEDVMNPGNPTSIADGWEGWRSFRDSTRGPDTTVHVWMGQWKDANGDVVTTDLAYTSAGDHLQPQNDLLQVMFKFLSADVVRHYQAAPAP
jgi:hypothetical protein